jgi:hypothetical protein
MRCQYFRPRRADAPDHRHRMGRGAPEESSVEQTMGRYGRRGTKWFSFDLLVDPEHPITVGVIIGDFIGSGLGLW